MLNKNNLTSYIFFTLLFLSISFSACKKFVDAGGPQTQLNGENVYNTDVTAIAVMTGMYSSMANGVPSPNFASGLESLSLRSGLSADEFILFTGASANLIGFYNNALLSNDNTRIGTDYWNVFYDYIYFANTAIEGLNGSKGLSESVKDQLMGEAKFMRAFFYFYLVNLYGDVPLVITTDHTINRRLPQSPAVEVYQQIIKDLKEAQSLLSPDYLDGRLQKYSGTLERIRPNKFTATALLARAYLYSGNWVNAETEATTVIDNTALYDTVSLNNVFLKNSKEAIWQLQVVKSNQNTDDSKAFIITSGLSSSTPVCLSDTLLNSFELGDRRAKPKNWIDTIRIPATTGSLYYFPYKYKNNTTNVTEYIMVFRLAEQYLIRAEARANGAGTGLSGAIADVSRIRTRAGLSIYSGPNNKDSVLKAIYHERQIELFSEWGHHWFDLKRTNTIDAVMNIITPKKAGGTQWQSFQKLYPIPFSELLLNSNLIQNLGY